MEGLVIRKPLKELSLGEVVEAFKKLGLVPTGYNLSHPFSSHGKMVKVEKAWVK